MIDLSSAQIIFSLLLGVVLGTLFFGTLLLTVSHVIRSEYPLSLLIVSVLIRMVLLMTSLFLLLHYLNWQAVIFAVTGFLAARTMIVSVSKNQRTDK